MERTSRWSSRSGTLSDVASLAEERRAYRHHRKRLARIVADQWMYAARFRLVTLKFRKQRQQNLQRSCIAEWRNVVEHRLRMSQIFERASVLCRFLMERRSFQKWKKFLYSKRVLVEAFQRTVHMARCKQQTMILTTLQNHSQAKIMKRQLWVKAHRFQILNVLKTCRSQWSSFVQERLLVVQMKTRAQSKWKNYRLKLALNAWKEALLMMETRAHDKWTNYRLRLVLSAWKNFLLLKLEKVHEDGRAPVENPETLPQVSGIDKVDGAAFEDSDMEAQILTKCFWRWYLLASQKSKWLTERWMQISDLLL